MRAKSVQIGVIKITQRKANDGSASAPRMEVHQAMWAMQRYGDNGTEWPLERKLEEIAAAGFSGIFGGLPAPGEEKLWRSQLERHGLSFGLETFPSSARDLREALERASDYDVLYVNAQVKDAFTTGREAVELLQSLYEEAARFDKPFFVETHRGRITQDLIRTAEYVQAIPELALTIDLSHYVVAGEMHDFTQALPYLHQLLQRTASIHGRVSNAEQIQIDIGENGDHPMAARFADCWRSGMRSWLSQAGQGDVLPFVCEIGHHYSVTPDFLPSDHSDAELSDRWKQSKLFKRIAESLWQEVQQELESSTIKEESR